MPDDPLVVFAKAFIHPARRGRWLTLLGSKKGRDRLLADLDHGYDFDPKLAEPLGPCDHRAVLQALRKAGAWRLCLVLSSNALIDGQTMELEEAVEAVVAQDFGTYLICDPERLAFFESEDKGQRYLLRRKPDSNGRRG